MKCRLCNRFFNLEDSFSFLFRFPEICPDCTENFKPNLKTEVIPINGGVINYHYLYEKNLSFLQKTFLERHNKIFFKMMQKAENSDETVILIDEGLLHDLKNWAQLIFSLGDVTIYSLQYHDLSYVNFLD
jgi:hypothetical protein